MLLRATLLSKTKFMEPRCIYLNFYLFIIFLWSISQIIYDIMYNRKLGHLVIVF